MFKRNKNPVIKAAYMAHLSVEYGAGSETYDFCNESMYLNEDGSESDYNPSIWQIIKDSFGKNGPKDIYIEYPYGYEGRRQMYEDLETGVISVPKKYWKGYRPLPGEVIK